MPIIVDRDQIRMDILMAFQRCIERKPMMNVSLRDIAAEAGMSHAKLLNYFESKNDLILAYVRYTREYMSEKCSQWFAGHDRADYASNLAYMNAFMDYVANAPAHEQRPNATTQTYVLARYDPEIGRARAGGVPRVAHAHGAVPHPHLRRGGRYARGRGDDDPHRPARSSATTIRRSPARSMTTFSAISAT